MPKTPFSFSNVNMGKIWDAIGGSMGYGGSGAAAVKGYRAAGLGGKTMRDTARASIWANRFAAGAMVGAAAGATWGAVSDRESMVGGALKGAFVGGAARVGGRMLLNTKIGAGVGSPLRSLMKINNTRDLVQNVKRSWEFMGQGRKRYVRNAMVGVGAFGAIRGAFSGDDNPIGGVAGGAIAGSMQGAALGGAFIGAKKIFKR